jgi:NADP-dependent 3-hydroxy acid dehydrogenase YdfG
MLHRPCENRTVLITGASSGIGEACAHAFAAAGARLVLWARRMDRLEALAETLREQHGTPCSLHPVDVRDKAAVERAVSCLAEPFASVEVLVNNAGLSRGLEPIHEGVDENWEEMIDTNIKGLLWTTRAISQRMVSRGHGTIINMASIAGLQPYKGGNVYGATKAAVQMLSQNMQVDLNGTGVRVCCIDPGLVETEFSIVRFRGDAERASTVYKGYQPLSAADIADTVLYVATRPAHVSIQNILITPTAQATATVVDKRPA